MERALRDLARKRLQLVQQRTLHILSIESLLARQINLRMNGEHIQRMDDAAVRALALPAHVERAMMANMGVLRSQHCFVLRQLTLAIVSLREKICARGNTD
jgi:transposase